MSSAIVVGAGFAGLAAADALARGGHDVVVLEATDRVGGRVWSERLENGSIIERGAEWVLPGYETMRELAARFGLTFREKGALYGDRDPRDGPPVTRDELLAAVGQLRDARGASLAEAIESLPATEGARAAIASRLAISTAHELDDQPASILADGAAGFGAFPSHGIDGGNDALAHSLAASLDVRLKRRVARIAWSDEGAIVDGEHAEACVVATPAHAVTFDPPLPGWKQGALDAVRYGEAAKLFLPLDHEVEPSATLSVPGRFWTWTEHGSRAACSFAGTQAALERLEIENGPERWAVAVRLLRPDLPYADAEPVLVTWPGGAYSARSLSSPLDDEALARSVGPIAFAGEHTAGEWHGLMEGALRSGRRAAAQCLR
ncbi:MAG: flavin monoamine oxidase family protein [Gaiellaceae bacterium]